MGKKVVTYICSFSAFVWVVVVCNTCVCMPNGRLG